MQGKLIIIEAGDASGKATQTEKLFRRLSAEHYQVKQVTYPNYDSDSSALIKMYLKGEFGSDPNQVNPYAASSFYAVDRFASYKKEWEQFYLKGGIIIADRYTTSNMVHQAAKISDAGAREEYLSWLWDFEFRKLQLPVPDCVIFLDMPPEFAGKLIAQRANKLGAGEKDIHENNHRYLVDSYVNACAMAGKYQWHRVSCVREGCLLTIDEIHEKIYNIVTGTLLLPSGS